jgi:hypothetical protein
MSLLKVEIGFISSSINEYRRQWDEFSVFEES